MLHFSGVISFLTVLTGWVERSRSSVFLIKCFVFVGIVGSFVVGVRVCLTTTIVIVGTVLVISGLVFFSFELTALVGIVTWLFALAASWFGLFGGLLCRLLRRSVYVQLFQGFQTIQSQFPFKMRHILFICAILRMRLVN